MDSKKKVVVIGKAKDLMDLGEQLLTPAAPRRFFRNVRKLTQRPASDYPDMPKLQPCPTCRRSCKRDKKTMGGAMYQCRNCGASFLVKTPERKFITR